MPTRSRLGAAALAALMAASSLAPAWAQAPAPANPERLPALGESASADLSISQERRIGDAILREGRRDPAYLDDPILLEYVQQLYAPLLRAARARGDIEPDVDAAFAWEIFLVNDRAVNAFALPGGYVGVHLGLIALTTTPDALASVLAHELTHVTQRHIARSIAPQQQASLLAVAGLLLGVLAASRANTAGAGVDGVQAAVMGGQAAAIQTQLNFTRAMEREADRVGFGLLADAGYNTGGMAQMFEKLDFASRINDTNNFPYLRTHPLTSDRITEARTRVLAAPMPAPEPTLRHALMQARARVLMDPAVQSLVRLSGESSSPLAVERVAARLAGALAASRLKDHARAERQAAEARAMAAALPAQDALAERALVLMHAEVRQAAGDARGALALLDALPPLPPAAAPGAARAAMLQRAQLLLDLHRARPGSEAPGLRASTEALQTWLAEHPQDATAWERLSGTADALGQRLRSLRAAAEARAMLGDLTGAIDRFRVAQQAARGAQGQQDFIEASVIDVRLRDVTAQRRELQVEARGGRP
ncbi:MAG: M48 family metalloprotease [Burkholderiaceae bacterium]|nr:M48 family metalloprotease [Burkholderiaceae bacterium]